MRGSLREAELAGKIKQAGVDAFGRATKGNLKTSLTSMGAMKTGGAVLNGLKSKVAGAPMVGAAKKAVTTGKIAGPTNIPDNMQNSQRKAISSLF
jgi:hypothetical protein